MEDRVLETFLQLVKIDSESFHEGAAVDFVCKTAKRCGFDYHVDDAGKAIGGEAGNVYVKMPATGVDAPPVIFSSHLDTVSPGKGVEPVVSRERIVSRGETILGADCKAGVAVAIELMYLSREGKLSHGPLELVFTVAEEKQLLGARYLEWDRLQSRHAYVLDGAGPVGDVINASPTQENLRFVFKGKAAHAGVEPEKGRTPYTGRPGLSASCAWGASTARRRPTSG